MNKPRQHLNENGTMKKHLKEMKVTVYTINVHIHFQILCWVTRVNDTEIPQQKKVNIFTRVHPNRRKFLKKPMD